MAKPLALLLLVVELSFIAAGCGIMRRMQGDSFPQRNASTPEGATDNEVVIETTESGGVVTGKLSGSSTGTQRLNASPSSSIAGSSVMFPPGAVTIDTAVTLEEGLDLSSDGALTELGIADAQSASPSVVLSSDPPVNPTKPFTVQIGTSSSASLLEEGLVYFIVYKVLDVAANKTYVGSIPSSNVTLANGVAKFEIQFFGSYQLFKGKVSPEAKTVETQKPIVTKRDQAQAATNESGADGEDVVTTGPVKLDNASVVDGATNVEPDETFTFRFNQPIDSSTAQSSIVLFDENDAPLACDYAFPSPNEVQVTPQARMKYLKLHTLKVVRGLKGTSNAELDGDLTYKFTVRGLTLRGEEELDANTGHMLSPSKFALAGNADGKMVVAWEEDASSSYARYFDGASWSAPFTLDAASGADKFRAVVTESGKACVSWLNGDIKTSCFNGTSWQAATIHDRDPSDPGHDSHLVESGSDHVVLLWWEQSGGTYRLHSADWSGSTWTYQITVFINGTVPNAHPTKSIAANSAGQHVYAWHEGGLGLHGVYGTGSVWEVDSVFANPTMTLPPRVAISSSGEATVAWTETPGDAKSRRYLSGWQSINTIFDPMDYIAERFDLAQADSRTHFLFKDLTNDGTNGRDVQSAIKASGADFTTYNNAHSGGMPTTGPVGTVGSSNGDFNSYWYDNGTPKTRHFDASTSSFSLEESWITGSCDANELLRPTLVTTDAVGDGYFACTNVNGSRSGHEDLHFSRYVKGQGVAADEFVKNEGTNDYHALGMHTAADGRTWLVFLEASATGYALKVKPRD